MRSSIPLLLVAVSACDLVHITTHTGVAPATGGSRPGSRPMAGFTRPGNSSSSGPRDPKMPADPPAGGGSFHFAAGRRGGPEAGAAHVV
jgi:hypothetical protein